MVITKKQCLWGCFIVIALCGSFCVPRLIHKTQDAIPATGGEVLGIPPIATAHYLQNDARWKNATIGGSGERLADVGCTVCSLAMALDHYGVRTTPGELNEFLKQNDGYTDRGWLKWSAVSEFSRGKVTTDYIGAPTHARIDRALKNKQPVIAKILISGSIPHWVLIVGKERDDYLIRDPLDDGATLQRLSRYDSKIYAMRTLRSAR